MTRDLYYWGGRRQLENPVLRRKRTISSFDGEQPVDCPWDIRRWVFPDDDSFMKEIWQEIKAEHRNDFAESSSRQADLSAKAIWHFVVERIAYLKDDRGHDFWQFPPETLSLKQGDCEDKSFLAVSLMLAAGIPKNRVRVTVGAMQTLENGTYSLFGHAWPMYRTSRGVWCILESCLRHLPIHGQDGGLQAGAPEDVGIEKSVFLNANRMSRDKRRMQYIPLLCLGREFVWTVEETRPGQIQSAAHLHPDWRQKPEFRALWKREMTLDHGPLIESQLYER